MPARAASPAGSEYDFDISNALGVGNGFDSGNESDNFLGRPSGTAGGDEALDVNDVLEGEDGSDDDETFIAAQQAARNRKASTIKGKSVKKGGGFQAMGLSANLLKAIAKKGFSVPTPIQRKTIPLLLEGIDVVGMARTGSGKTAAFVIPMIERLKVHSAKVGARAIILSPSRELALQTMKVVKELGRGTDLRTVLLVGGDSLEEQFSFMAENPDIIIATPGRFLHLKVEMNLDLKSVEYIVFDEADRLFEMGFASQLTEILHALPTNRQTLLFSATLPKVLTEFAKAGLQEPRLVRLDADAKMSEDLESAFFSVTSSEKEGALIHLLRDVIKIPMGSTESTTDADCPKGKKRKRGSDKAGPKDLPSSHSTIVFTATKHHVEYISRLLTVTGFSVSYVYGELDQVARRNQVARFRSGETPILVVTDVAARGIDIPVLANVINYNFPPQPKVFIHRVGRTARAGRRGWAYSFVRVEEAPYLLDLQLFLGRKLVFNRDTPGQTKSDYDYAKDVVIGSLKRDEVERAVESVNKLLEEDVDLYSMRGVHVKGEKQYNRSRPSASKESAKRAKQLVAQKGWRKIHPLFVDDINDLEEQRTQMLLRVANFRPNETIFEIGQRGLNKSEAAEVMKRRREKITIDPVKHRKAVGTAEDADYNSDDSDDDHIAADHDDSDHDDDIPADSDHGADSDVDMSSASDSDLRSTFTTKPAPKYKPKSRKPASYMDSEHFMSYTPSTSLAESRGYSINDPSSTTVSSSFASAAASATLDLTLDSSSGFREAHKARGVRWDKKAKKYVRRENDEDGSKGAKMIIGESGQKIAASFRSGKFEAWKKANRIERMPKVGEMEKGDGGRRIGGGPVMGGRRGGRMVHKSVKAPKRPDKARDDYEVRKKRYAEAKEKGLVKSAVKSELRSVQDIGKNRRLKERRREKNNRPSKKRKL
ncbi:DEAD-domain-containing protein [Ascodesmis nigricans]|uniref:RNA helicase n=1 Tax=Ascodesmis nigricans TaxID=341454 RepID=A0A4S2N4V7_9PEZI|nr:DEAD-domain-containing protein [Ascodesmis nigricans]